MKTCKTCRCQFDESNFYLRTNGHAQLDCKRCYADNQRKRQVPLKERKVARRVGEIRELLQMHKALTARQLNNLVSHYQINDDIRDITSLALIQMSGELTYGEAGKQWRLREMVAA